MSDKKFQPITKIFIPNDKLSKVLFDFSAEDFKDFTDGEEFKITEGEKYDKRKRCKLPVKTSAALQATNQAYRNTPLDMFDRAVLAICQSALLNGQTKLTAGTIYRAMTGKMDSQWQKPTPKFEDEIMASVYRLSGINLKADLSAVNAAYGYNDGLPVVIPFTPVLPCHIDAGDLQGGNTDRIIYLDAVSPLMTIAQLKKQVLAFQSSLLDTGSRHNNRQSIAAKFYTMTRVLETIRPPKSKFTRELQPVITFEKLFEQCRITDATDYTKNAVCGFVTSLLRNLEGEGIIENSGVTFSVNKKNAGNFTFDFIKKDTVK